MKDERGVVQLWTASPNGGPLRQVTRNSHNIASAFTWSPDGRRLAHIMDGSVCVTDTATGRTHRLTADTVPTNASAPRPEACVISPDGQHIAYIRQVDGWNQVFVLSLHW